MVKVYIRVCFLCRIDGKLKEATHTYRTPNDDEYDVCERHAKLCKTQGLEVSELLAETEIQQD